MSDDRYENVEENYEGQSSNKTTYNSKPVTQQKYDDYSIVGFICAILGTFFFPPILGTIAIVFSQKSRKRIAEDSTLKGDGLALAGLIIGIIEVAISILGIVFFIVLAMSIF